MLIFKEQILFHQYKLNIFSDKLILPLQGNFIKLSDKQNGTIFDYIHRKLIQNTMVCCF